MNEDAAPRDIPSFMTWNEGEGALFDVPDGSVPCQCRRRSRSALGILGTSGMEIITGGLSGSGRATGFAIVGLSLQSKNPS